MNILLSIIDCLKILAQAIRFSILNIAIENNRKHRCNRKLAKHVLDINECAMISFDLFVAA